MNIPDDQIDLRPIIRAILKNIWVIVFVTLLFAAVAFLYSYTRTHQYKSTAILLLTRSRPVLSLANQFPTVTEPIDSRSRMDALLSIAESDALLQNTMVGIEYPVPSEYQAIDVLKSRLDINSKGDSITVAATTGDPQLSAEIANAWADQIVETINLAYSGEQPLNEIQQQLKSAKSEYDSAQAELESFFEKNPKTTLEQKHNELKHVYDLMGFEQLGQIEYLFNRQQAMEELSYQARALRKQLEGGNQSDAGNQGDALSVLLARMNTLGIRDTTNPPNLDLVTGTAGQLSDSRPPIIQQPAEVVVTVQIDGANNKSDDSDSFVADIDSLIQLIDEEKDRADEAIDALAEDILNESNSSPLLNNTASRLQILEKQLESTRSQEEELTTNRDLAWQAYQALAQKET